jgi:hypothetical protein
MQVVSDIESYMSGPAGLIVQSDPLVIAGSRTGLKPSWRREYRAPQ